MSLRALLPKPLKRAARRSIELVRARALRHRLSRPPLNKLTPDDERLFASALAVWKPTNRPEVVALRWLITEICPYSCSYCAQRHKLTYDGKLANHAFANHPVEKWRQAFERHFSARRLSLTITGGEPMADRGSIIPLVNALTAMPTVECIRIDTNAFWDCGRYEELNRSKLIFNCSYHPEQTGEEAYFGRIERIAAAGFRIGMVNYVFYKDRWAKYREFQQRLRALGVPINPNPEFTTVRSADEQEFLSREIPPIDYQLKARRVSPRGRPCLYPAVAYMMDYTGALSVGCLSVKSGSFFDRSLPLRPVSPMRCPNHNCGCLDQYAFLAGQRRSGNLNLLGAYSQELLALQPGSQASS